MLKLAVRTNLVLELCSASSDLSTETNDVLVTGHLLQINLFQINKDGTRDLLAETNFQWPEPEIPTMIKFENGSIILTGKTVVANLPFRLPHEIVDKIGQSTSDASAVRLYSWSDQQPSTSSSTDKTKSTIWKNIAKLCGKETAKELRKNASDSLESIPIFTTEQQLKIIDSTLETEHLNSFFSLVEQGIFTNSVALVIINRLIQLDQPAILLNYVKVTQNLCEQSLLAAIQGSIKGLESDTDWQLILSSVLDHSFTHSVMQKQLSNLNIEEAIIFTRFLKQKLTESENSNISSIEKAIDWFSVLLDAQASRLLLNEQFCTEIVECSKFIYDTNCLWQSYGTLKTKLSLKFGSPTDENENSGYDYIVESLVF